MRIAATALIKHSVGMSLRLAGRENTHVYNVRAATAQSLNRTLLPDIFASLCTGLT